MRRADRRRVVPAGNGLASRACVGGLVSHVQAWVGDHRPGRAGDRDGHRLIASLCPWGGRLIRRLGGRDELLARHGGDVVRSLRRRIAYVRQSVRRPGRPLLMDDAFDLPGRMQHAHGLSASPPSILREPGPCLARERVDRVPPRPGRRHAGGRINRWLRGQGESSREGFGERTRWSSPADGVRHASCGRNGDIAAPDHRDHAAVSRGTRTDGSALGGRMGR